MTQHFRFQNRWALDASADRVYAVLADVEGYAAWWPQVRTAERVDEQSGRTSIRSLLPYSLDLVLRREVEDPGRRLLRVSLSGDLEGWCQWRVAEAADRSTVADFEQEAVVTPTLLARTAALAAPLLRANHAWMMHSGRSGLAAYLRCPPG